MQNKKEWFSLILAMWIVLVISLTAYNILEYIIPFSREIKWVENSAKSYYLANSWIEEWLYYVSERDDIDEKDENWKSYSGSVSNKYNTFSSWAILPQLWEGNSDYDDDDDDWWWVDHNRNTISQWNPIQLSIWNEYLKDVSDFKIAFRTPDLDKGVNEVTWYNPETLSWWTNLVIINWQLSSLVNTLNASGWLLKVNDILDSSKKDFNNDASNLFDNVFKWFDLNWNDWIKLKDFYTNNCTWTNSWCTLKFSIVNDLILKNTNNVRLPYLEWKIKVSNWKTLPLRYTKIESKWKSMWYKKELNIKVPRRTVNQAFDFTVFQ